MARKKIPIDRRRLLIDGARELFGRYGFEKTTVDDIARHTGIGKGSVYLEFKTKEDILIAIIDEFAHHMHTYMDQCVSEARAPY
ncbi:MAG: helix-turn-helix domain-containing protein [Cyanobacteriota/Melainabacteria group bacterium]